MTSKWEPVRQLLAHMCLDDDLMLQWGLIEHGDVRSAEGQQALIRMKRDDLHRLHIAVARRADPPKPQDRVECAECGALVTVTKSGLFRKHTNRFTELVCANLWNDADGKPVLDPARS